jgi:hypothetical protein
MSKQALNTLKNWFKTGLKPTQAQFWDWLDSFWHKDEKIPVEQVEGLSELLNDSVSLTQFNSGLAAKADTTHTHTSSDLTDWLGYVPEDPAAKNQPEGYAGLDAAGKISAAQLPAIALNNTFVVDSEEDMLSLVAETGDVAIRSDENKTYILAGEDPGEIEDWQELLATMPPVGNGLTLESEGIGLGGTLAKSTVINIPNITNKLYVAYNGENVIDFGFRFLYKGGSAAPVVDWGTGVLSDGTGNESIRWMSRHLKVGARVIVDWENAVLRSNNTPNTVMVDWNAMELKNYNGLVLVNWGTTQLRDQTNQLAVDWQQKALYYNSNPTINWASGEIMDTFSSPKIALHYNNRQMYDFSGVPSIHWGMRLLHTTSGSAVIDFSSNSNGLQYMTDYSANYTPRSLVDKAYVDKLKPIEIEIGDWDMETEPIKIIPHGLSNWKNVRKISCIVRNDDDTFRLFLNNNTHNNLDNSGIAIDGTNIYITSGNNDYTTYQSTSYNRGYITVEFKS